MYEQLANQYAGYELPQEIKDSFTIGIGERMFGSRSFAKIKMFIQEQKLENNMNEVIDFYMSIKPQRQDGEGNAEYKNRTKFQKLLYKNRKYLYNYAVYEK